ncbi:T9SS type A sorting domain-containing protein [Hymenobacter sp. ASUV-10]|uniref:T9SS type A sorting domain-containing protein n=1 Tax=Hymenobacter aranciens TaxID=3063996 RepID=A0ABT9BHC1_9BACT|nr:T9SS type A sorting domain-containing protein [Hymenobacter sp. ASUV-10]MDO7877654.1 T9SS type A sorting domain-containing protein [Hymenobacter sp. ASUV-10]
MGQATFRYEAALNNQITTGSTMQTIVNSSPVSPSNPAFFIPWKQASLLSNTAFDADGDSLVYSLDQPISACGNVYVSYKPYPSFTQVQLSPNCYLLPGSTLPAMFSATNPVVVRGDITGNCPSRTLVPSPNGFAFDATTGALLVDPSRYVANSPSADGENKYVVVVKITEYRKISGSYVVVGSTRRDLFVTVYDCGTNQMLTLTRTIGVQVGTSQVQQPIGMPIPVLAGEPISVNLTATDRNPGQTLTLSLMHNNVPGVTLQNPGSGVARLNFTPPLRLPNGLYRVPVTVEDNACPLRGNETQLLTFRVHRTLATRAATTIAAYPTPFTSEVQFQLTKSGVQQLGVYDQLGRLVTTLRSQADGSVRWQPGTELPAGLYFARSGDGSQLIRLLRSDTK